MNCSITRKAPSLFTLTSLIILCLASCKDMKTVDERNGPGKPPGKARIVPAAANSTMPEKKAPESRARKVDVDSAREVFSSLKKLSRKGNATAMAPFMYDRRARAFVGRMKAEDLVLLFDGTVDGYDLNGGRVLFHLSDNPKYKVAALFSTESGFKYDPLVSIRYKEPDPGKKDKLNHPVPLSDATAGIKGDGRLFAKLDTSIGVIECELFEDKAPATVANFVGLALGRRGFFDKAAGRWVKRPFYDELIFHRVIPRFMIQGGCPSGTGRDGPGYSFKDEFDVSLRHNRPGQLSMANSGPNTNGSQFFITEAATPWLDDHHSIFGQCGPMDLVNEIARVPATDARPKDPVRIHSVGFSRRQD